MAPHGARGEAIPIDPSTAHRRWALAWSWASTAALTACVAGVAATQPPGWWALADPAAWWQSVMIWMGLLGGMGTLCLASLVASWVHLAQLDRRADQDLPTASELPHRHMATMRTELALGALLGVGGPTLAAGVLLAAPSGVHWIGPMLVVAAILGLPGMALFFLGVLRLSHLRLKRTRPDAPYSDPAPLGLDHPIPALHLGVLATLMMGAVGMQATLVRWYIEDAAISFTYARHIAAGEGSVTYLGGERVEGYSNPLWTFLMVLWEWAGVDGFTSSKLMAAAMAAATVPLVYLLAREARPHRRDLVPLLAALCITVDAQFAIWGASGLENPLFTFLLAGGMWRVVVEGRRGGPPWSALWFLGLALTRPEGILYAAFAGAWASKLTLARLWPGLRDAASGQRLRAALRMIAPTVAWLALFFVPWLAYQAAHYAYFAWPFPNTYYAKKGRKTAQLFEWKRGGWKYLRNYGMDLAQAWLIPVFLLGIYGHRGRGLRLAMVSALLFAVVLLVPSTSWLKEGRPIEILALCAAAGVLAMLTLLSRHRAGRVPPEAIATALLLLPLVALGSAWALGLADAPPLRALTAPPWWANARVWTLLTLAILPPLAMGRRPGGPVLGLAWGICGLALFFAVYASGDWMRGFRWMASLSAPAAVLFAVGLAEAADGARRLTRHLPQWLLALASVLITVASIVALHGIWGAPARGLLSPIANRMTAPWWWAFPGAVLLGLVLGGAVHRWGRRPERWRVAGSVVVWVGLAAWVVPNVLHLQSFNRRPETSPYSVQKRSNYYDLVQRRLFLDRATLLDVDMGALMWWNNGRIIVDAAGLVDPSTGHHWQEKPFIREYIFQERRPDIAHMHGAWASTVKVKTFPEWRNGYVGLPDYPTSPHSTHPGNFLRRDVILHPAWTGDRPGAVRFSNGTTLVGWSAPSGEAAPGRSWYVEVGMRRPVEGLADFRLLLFLTDGVHTQSWELPPGYDWVEPAQWRDDEIFVGRYAVPLRDDLPTGRYELGLVVLDGAGSVAAVPTGPDAPPLPEGLYVAGNERPAVVAVGELRYTDAVSVVAAERLEQHAEEQVQRVHKMAQSTDCAAATQGWLVARRTLVRDEGFALRHGDEVRAALASCHIVAAEGVPVPLAVSHLERARWLAPHLPGLSDVTTPLADSLVAHGHTARTEGDWESAYTSFDDALRIEPHRAWARRLVEEARDHRLGLDADSLAAAELEESERATDVRTLSLPADTDPPPIPRGRMNLRPETDR